MGGGGEANKNNKRELSSAGSSLSFVKEASLLTVQGSQ